MTRPLNLCHSLNLSTHAPINRLSLSLSVSLSQSPSFSLLFLTISQFPFFSPSLPLTILTEGRGKREKGVYCRRPSIVGVASIAASGEAPSSPLLLSCPIAAISISCASESFAFLTED